MPICPGCEQTVPYERLDVHQRYCEGIWSDELAGTQSIERLDRRLAAMEARMDRRFRDFETDFDRRLSVIDAARGTVRRAKRRE